MANRILIVDDEEAIIRTVSLLLSKEGYDCRSASSLQGAKRECAQHEFDLAIVDLHLREDDGKDVLAHIRGLDAGIECIILTAFGTIDSAVECMRHGALDYLAKPVDPAELVLRVGKALDHRSLTGEVERLRKKLGARDRLSEVVAESRVMQQIVELIERIRGQDIPVLITGETGTGKEIVARAVHATSRRSEKPFIAINCNTLPEDLLDSELFGHLKGAYTGAISGGKGLFQQAHQGTLFLDEIGDVSLRLQSKLLRVLQEGEVRPVGGTTPDKVDVRIIAATNQDLESLVANGEFRADLYFRLNVLPIHIPPLRQRAEDVPALIDNFLGRLRTHLGRPDLELTAAAREKLMSYDYPGNARELENIIKRAFALASAPHADAGDIVFNRVGAGQAATAEQDNVSLSLEDMTVRHIRRVLAFHNGNQVAAARALGISRSTLRRKLGQSC